MGERFMEQESLLKKETKRFGCAIAAAVIFAVNIKTFVRAGGLFPGGANGITLLIQGICQEFFGLAVPFTIINLTLNAIPVYIGFRFIGKKFTFSSCCVIFLTGILTDLIPSQPITYDPLLISIFGGLINGGAITLCLIGNTSSGGTDFIAIFFSEKSGRDIWNYIFCCNACVLVIAGMLFGCCISAIKNIPCSSSPTIRMRYMKASAIFPITVPPALRVPAATAEKN